MYLLEGVHNWLLKFSWTACDQYFITKELYIFSISQNWKTIIWKFLICVKHTFTSVVILVFNIHHLFGNSINRKPRDLYISSIICFPHVISTWKTVKASNTREIYWNVEILWQCEKPQRRYNSKDIKTQLMLCIPEIRMYSKHSLSFMFIPVMWYFRKTTLWFMKLNQKIDV